MTEKERRISDIVNKLKSLTLEANVLTHELGELRRPNESPLHAHGSKGNKVKSVIKKEKNTSYEHDFIEGDKVVITNGYQKKRGTEGTVIHTSRTQVTIKDQAGTIYVRKSVNLKRIQVSK